MRREARYPLRAVLLWLGGQMTKNDWKNSRRKWIYSCRVMIWWAGIWRSVKTKLKQSSPISIQAAGITLQPSTTNKPSQKSLSNRIQTIANWRESFYLKSMTKGNNTWPSLKAWSTETRKPKLMTKWIGPFKMPWMRLNSKSIRRPTNRLQGRQLSFWKEK